MAHPTDTEETVKGVEVCVRDVHGRCDVSVVAHGLVAGDDGVGAAVVGEEFAAVETEGGQVPRVSAYVSMIGI